MERITGSQKNRACIPNVFAEMHLPLENSEVSSFTLNFMFSFLVGFVRQHSSKALGKGKIGFASLIPATTCEVSKVRRWWLPKAKQYMSWLNEDLIPRVTRI